MTEFDLSLFEDEDVFGDLFWDGERLQRDGSKLVRHRKDGPAVIWADGTKMWCLNGKLHREDGPAVIWADGRKEWYLNGKRHREAEKEFNLDDFEDEDIFGDLFWDGERLQQDRSKWVRHREDGPVVILADGIEEWWLNYKRHREDGPAIIYANGTKIWYLNGELHREDGPAVIYANGTKEWWLNGKLHREDGPARIWASGSVEWWFNGERIK